MIFAPQTRREKVLYRALEVLAEHYNPECMWLVRDVSIAQAEDDVPELPKPNVVVVIKEQI